MLITYIMMDLQKAFKTFHFERVKKTLFDYIMQ